MTYAINGQQVLRDGAHFADAANPEAAKMIVDALNRSEPFGYHDYQPDMLDEPDDLPLDQNCPVRREGDEYYCPKHNVRYGVDEDHP